MKKGIILCLIIAIPSFLLGQHIKIIGAPVFGILFGMLANIIIKDKSNYDKGIKFCSKKLLQLSIILLGFGLNMNIIVNTGKKSLPIIIITISVALLTAFIMKKILKIDTTTAILIGVGSSICGGSAIAATSSVINAKEEQISQSISVIFFFNVLAAIIFPKLGAILNFSTVNGDMFGLFAGTAINDTSSVSAAASIWDSTYNLGTQTLNTAITVKLTRTLAIIPITLILGIYTSKRNNLKKKIKINRLIPNFIILFILASIFTTILNVDPEMFKPIKILSKFLIVLAMTAIGINTNIIKLIKTGIRPLILGLFCSISIIISSLLLIL